jgi:hypothetical protein
MTRLIDDFHCMLCGDLDPQPIEVVTVRQDDLLATVRCPSCANLIGHTITVLRGLWLVGLGAQLHLSAREVEDTVAEIRGCPDVVGRLRQEVDA